jgi:NADPH:quinone reductase-like Zn-dependent oxidoreductase
MSTYLGYHIEKFLPETTQYGSLTPSALPSRNPNKNSSTKTVPSTHVVVDITHTAINHVDLLYSRGLHQNNHSGLVRPPMTLGLEFAGIVSYVPPGASWSVGDRVWGGTIGSHAEEACVPATSLRRVPDNVTLESAAGIGAGSAPVSYGALVRCGQIKAGMTVLVHAAAGGLGVSAVQIAHALGCNVIGTVGSQGKKDALMKELGDQLTGVVVYDKDGWEKDVVKMAGGEGVDVVYDTVGLVLSSIRCVKFGGAVVIAGFAGRGGVMEKVAMNRVLLKNVRLLGYRFGESGRRIPGETERCWQGTEELMRKGQLKGVTYGIWKGLGRVAEGMEELKGRKVWGKLVVEVKSEVDALKEVASVRGKL